ncbi:nitrogenase molybdenum-cofactor synthesis protein NifE [Azospirillum brasilense]|uniref:Nitrogenase molybdenum-cofactor synthesis protein NifE n=1 Tax=Azospirillum brasilense TaxID=192 RepID=A0A560CSR5_AZOBR|nr:nitrogenase component 1 [Azospirillum brasilense]TWA87887.1 nitrogenase molybdenum-cofactor synthesis protein NifE [Azospirillum brasilense]
MTPAIEERMGLFSELVEAVEADAVHIREGLDMHQFCAYWGAHEIFGYIDDCVCLVHGTAGCMSNRRFLLPFGGADQCHMEPQYTTAFSEHDVIFGGERKLAEAVALVQERHDPRLIAVITNCCADIIGDDVGGVVRGMQREGQRVVWLHTAGFTGKSYRKGSEEAFRVLAGLMAEAPAKPVVPGTINLFPRRWIWGENQKREAAEGIRMLEKLGLRVNSILRKGIPYEEFLDLRTAEANVSQCFYWSMALFEEMATRFGTKSIKASNPIGLTASLAWMDATARAMNLDVDLHDDPEVAELLDLRERVRARLGGGRKAVIWTQTGEKLIGLAKFARDVGLDPIVVGVDPAVVRDKVSMFRKEVNDGFDVPLYLSNYVEEIQELVNSLGDPVVLCNEDYFPGHAVFRYQWNDQQAYGLAGARSLYAEMLTTVERRRSRYSLLGEVV